LLIHITLCFRKAEINRCYISLKIQKSPFIFFATFPPGNGRRCGKYNVLSNGKKEIAKDDIYLVDYESA